MLRAAGLQLVLLSNQSGVARGYFTVADVEAVNQAMASALLEEGACLDGVYYCPHHCEGSVAEFSIRCQCRKPAPGLIHRACEELRLDVSQSYMIGNKETDVEAGEAAGCTSILISSNRTAQSKADWIGPNLDSAACWILDRL